MLGDLIILTLVLWGFLGFLNPLISAAFMQV